MYIVVTGAAGQHFKAAGLYSGAVRRLFGIDGQLQQPVPPIERITGDISEGKRVLASAADHEVVAEAAGAVGERHGDGVGRGGRGGVVGAGLDQARHAGGKLFPAAAVAATDG